MSENLLTAETVEDQDSPESVTPDMSSTADRPVGLPDKFWDERAGAVRLESLIKSYCDLERKLGAVVHREVPSTPADYKIHDPDDLLGIDDEINKRLHDAGFSCAQAQLVYDLARERLLPIIDDLARTIEIDRSLERLEQHYGGRERWRETARQIQAWAKANLPAHVHEALASSVEGVHTLCRMMGGGEPGLLPKSPTQSGAATESELKAMMRDPRYWRDHDPVVVASVREGFRKLFPHSS